MMKVIGKIRKRRRNKAVNWIRIAESLGFFLPLIVYHLPAHFRFYRQNSSVLKKSATDRSVYWRINDISRFFRIFMTFSCCPTFTGSLQKIIFFYLSIWLKLKIVENRQNSVCVQPLSPPTWRSRLIFFLWQFRRLSTSSLALPCVCPSFLLTFHHVPTCFRNAVAEKEVASAVG